MDQRKGQQNVSQKDFLKQPVMCPWKTAQPYPSSLLNKNRHCTQNNTTSLTNHCSNNHWGNTSSPMETRNSSTYDSMQQSSSHFFHFLRLMQLFPHTHPATLHTVLCLCKNDFFCAVDKLLYAKRCKMLYNRSQTMHQQMAQNRWNPYCDEGSKCSHKRNQQHQCQSSKSSSKETARHDLVTIPAEASSENMQEANEIPISEQTATFSVMDAIVEPVGNIKYITIKASDIQMAPLAETPEDLTSDSSFTNENSSNVIRPADK